MLIIPLHRKPSAANWPWVTTLLIALNCLVWFGLQPGDDKAEALAQIRYFELELDRIEFPLYRQWRESGKAAVLPYDFDGFDRSMPEVMRRDLWFNAVTFDEGFAAALADGGELAAARQAADPQGRWPAARAEVERQLQRSVSRTYALRFDTLEPRRLLGAMFLHGSTGHLIGNMIFLALLGLLVEGAVGAWLFGALYVLAGVGAGLFSLAWRFGEAGYGLGASGAIAGLMGAYCVLWGLRRVRFFYWFFVVFNYVRAPALLLLPFWLGWEIWQLLFDKHSNVGFDAHAGGILSGALLALGIRALRWQRLEFLDEEVKRDALAEARAGVQDNLARMDWFAARRAAETLQAVDPDSFDSRLLVWRAWSTASGQPAEQHAAARAVLKALPWRLDQAAERKRVWTDYQRASGGRPQLAAAERLALAEGFARSGETELAFGLFESVRGEPELATAAAAAVFRLALALQEHDRKGFERAGMLLNAAWPDSVEAGKVQRLARL